MDKIAALTNVLQDPGRSQAEKEIAARALRSVNASDNDLASEDFPYQAVMTDATCAMLATLNVQRVPDLNEDICERHITAHCLHASDPIVREFHRQGHSWPALG